MRRPLSRSSLLVSIKKGESSVEIDAPIEQCFAIVADVDNASSWQGSLQETHVLHRGDDGRPDLVRTRWDALVTTVEVCLRYFYEEPTSIRWVKEAGDVRSLEGRWTFEDLGHDRTRATFSVAVDPGRLLGLLARGPAEAKVRAYLLNDLTTGLKKAAEA